MSNTLGTRIRELRNQKKLSQKEFGKLFTLAESTIGMYERDERKPDYEILEKIADHFGVSINYMFGRPDKNESTLTVAGQKNDLVVDEEFEAFANDPELERWYKDLPNSKEDDLQALKQMWEIIKKNKK